MSDRLIDNCVHYVARDLARGRVKKDAGYQAWPEETRKAKPEAKEKINAMTNMELLDLISIALDNA